MCRARKRRAPDPLARQRHHDPGFRVQRADPSSLQDIPRDRVRPPRLRAQQAPQKHDLDRGGASKVDRISAGQDRDLKGNRVWTFMGLLCRGGARARRPDLAGSLVLASGYYFPSVRADAVTMSGPAIPVIGDVIRHTLSPVLARLLWPLLTRKIFGPAAVPENFQDGFPKEMTFRPSQIRASSAESALDDLRRLRGSRELCRTQDANHHHCWRGRQADRHRRAVSTTACRGSEQHLSSGAGSRAHGTPNVL